MTDRLATACSYGVGSAVVGLRWAWIATRSMATAAGVVLVSALMLGLGALMLFMIGSLAGLLGGGLIDLLLPARWELSGAWVTIGGVAAIGLWTTAAGVRLLGGGELRYQLAEARRGIGTWFGRFAEAASDLTVDRAAARALNHGLRAQRAEDLDQLDLPAGRRQRRFPWGWPAVLLPKPSRGLMARPRPEPEGPLLTIEPFVGWRRWKVSPASSGGMEPAVPILGSAVLPTSWREGEAVARCNAFDFARHRDSFEVERHEAPDLDCGCGIYALKGPARELWAGLGVWAEGSVELTGRVLEGSLGYRAQRARILGPLSIRMQCTPTRDLRTWMQPHCMADPVAVAMGDDAYVPLCEHHRRLVPIFGGRELVVSHFREHVVERLQDRYGIRVNMELQEEPTWT